MKRGLLAPMLMGLFSAMLLFAQTPGTPASTSPAPAATEERADPQAIRKFNEEKVAELEKQIAGKEDQPSGVVFKNIQMFTPVPAGRLLKMMQLGFSNSLGVSCAHCHVVGEWDKEDKPQKQVARDMMKMVRTINNDLLKNIKNLKGPNPIVNCTTCHRGQVKPALDLETAGK
jgi:photosynthetic reaction center cytochrome c subunit